LKEILKKLRKEKGVLQKEMTELLNITERQYGNYEAGRVDPPTSKLIILADYFGVSLDYLVGRADSANIK